MRKWVDKNVLSYKLTKEVQDGQVRNHPEHPDPTTRIYSSGLEMGKSQKEVKSESKRRKFCEPSQ